MLERRLLETRVLGKQKELTSSTDSFVWCSKITVRRVLRLRRIYALGRILGVGDWAQLELQGCQKKEHTHLFSGTYQDRTDSFFNFAQLVISRRGAFAIAIDVGYCVADGVKVRINIVRLIFWALRWTYLTCLSQNADAVT